MNNFLSVLFFFLCVLCVCVDSKECTNIPTSLSSKTYRYDLMTSDNETWINDVFSHYHLTPTDDSTWSGLIPRKALKAEDEELNWKMVYRTIKNTKGTIKQGSGNSILSEVSLHNVTLDPNSMHGIAQKTNLEYLLMLNVDSLLWSFRKTAGLDTPGLPYGGWEAPNIELRGHFVGHYMSATAQMWASTHNEELKQKMDAVVTGLSLCQQKIGSGYLSAFPDEFFDRFEAVQPVWAPYYTIHKILAGLFDQYVFAGNDQALKMMSWMVDYFFERVKKVIARYTIERHYTSLNEETGGMNDVLYKLFTVTGNQSHLLLAHLFDKPCFLGELAVKADSISGYHGNTHIPLVVGAQMRYEVTGDPLYQSIGEFFMDIVNASHSYATGGTTVSEFWSDPNRLASHLTSENEESCSTYNMLKVSRHLFRWTKGMAYADYYERALTNGVLSIQRGTEPGIMIYMLPLQPGGSKARSYHKWGTTNNSFWCCYGTGIESFSKLGDSIYFEEKAKDVGLYIIQYISSTLDWELGQISLKQKVEPVVSWSPTLNVAVTITKKQQTAGQSTLNLRIPSWTSADAKAKINSQDQAVPPAGNFLSITRSWNEGDTINLNIPLTLRTEAIKDDRLEKASIQAILYGPYLLAGLSSGDWDLKTGNSSSITDWITPIPEDYNSNLISLVQENANPLLSLANLNQTIIMDSMPDPGTDSAVAATFRLIPKDPKTPPNSAERLVMLEPIDFPGTVVVHNGKGKGLGLANFSSASNSSQDFRLVPGLAGGNGTVSLESESIKGCYMCSSMDNKAKSAVQLNCLADTSDTTFNISATFKMQKGFTDYHPISFVAKGSSRNFLLLPLLTLRDESYTVYFNITS